MDKKLLRSQLEVALMEIRSFEEVAIFKKYAKFLHMEGR
jgi:hypothetical protein